MSLGPANSGEVLDLPMNNSLDYDSYFREIKPYPQESQEQQQPTISCMILPSLFEDQSLQNPFSPSNYDFASPFNYVTMLSPKNIPERHNIVSMWANSAF